MTRRNFLSALAVAPAVAMAPLEECPIQFNGARRFDFIWNEADADLLFLAGERFTHSILPGTILQIAHVNRINPPRR